jgi:hypothetical protein
MDVLVHPGEPDESRARIRHRTDDASQSRVPLIGFARERRGHREARSGMSRWERHEWSVPIMKAAPELEVLRVTVIHRWERSAGKPLPQTRNAGRKENRFRHVKRGAGQPGHSCHSAGRIETDANDKWTRPAKEREIARGVLKIVASLEALLLQHPRSPGVERRYSHSCQHSGYSRQSINLRDPWTRGVSAIAVRILRTKTGRGGSGGECRASGEEHMQEPAEIHFGIRCAM